MELKDLKVGDKVYIRKDLEHEKLYQDIMYIKEMGSGIMTISSKSRMTGGGVRFSVLGDKFSFAYSEKMIDWGKTKEIRKMDFKEMVDWDKTEELNKDKCNHDSVHSPSHYGGGGKHDIECYKAIEYILDRLENVPEKYFGHVSNIVKYIWRCNDKNGYEDLDKASVYFDFMFRKED